MRSTLLRKRRSEEQAGQSLNSFGFVNGASVLLPAQAVTALQHSPNVRSVEVDRVVQIPISGISAKGGKGGGGGKPPKDDPPPDEDPPPPSEEIPWGVDRIDADLAWSTSSGATVKVGIIDTGIDPGHPDLNVKGGINTISTRKYFRDDNGHGTHVAGTVAAVDNDLGVIGFAHSVELYAVKAFNKRGSAFTSDIIEGIQWCIDNGIQVINMSF
jgi:subtilisin family serine protease